MKARLRAAVFLALDDQQASGCHFAPCFDSKSRGTDRNPAPARHVPPSPSRPTLPWGRPSPSPSLAPPLGPPPLPQTPLPPLSFPQLTGPPSLTPPLPVPPSAGRPPARALCRSLPHKRALPGVPRLPQTGPHAVGLRAGLGAAGAAALRPPLPRAALQRGRGRALAKTVRRFVAFMPFFSRVAAR